MANLFGLFVLLCIVALVTFVSRERPLARRAAFAAYWVLEARYFWWRGTETLPRFEASVESGIAYAFMACELWLAYSLFSHFKLLQSATHRSPEADRQEGWYDTLPQPPSVALLIPTYQEDETILRKTITAAKQLEYPVKIWVLDDGRRAFVRDLSHELGVRYLTRSSNADYKAGNLNHAINHLRDLGESPEFFMVLDADFIVRPHFLRRTLSLFAEPHIGLVQTPQAYYNPDPFQYAFGAPRGWPDTQRLVFDLIMPGFDAGGGAYCCGTSFVVRRVCLEQIGGFPTESVSEDQLASLKMRALGWQSVYLNEILSVGLAPEGLEEHLTQQGRWCLGLLQIAKSPWGPMGGRTEGGRVRRWIDAESFLAWGTHSALRIVFMLVPLLYFAFALKPFDAQLDEFVSYFALRWLGTWTLIVWLSRGLDIPILGEAKTLNAAVVVVRATLRGLRGIKNAKFVATPKGRLRSRLRIHWRPLWWMALLTIAMVLGMAFAILSPAAPGFRDPFMPLSLFWTSYNVLVLVVAMAPCFEAAKHRAEERFDGGREPLEFQDSSSAHRVSLCDLSLSGAQVAFNGAPGVSVGADVALRFTDIGEVRAQVVRVQQQRAAVRFNDPGSYPRLVQKLFNGARYVRICESGSVPQVLGAIAKTLFK